MTKVWMDPFGTVLTWQGGKWNIQPMVFLLQDVNCCLREYKSTRPPDPIPYLSLIWWIGIGKKKVPLDSDI